MKLRTRYRWAAVVSAALALASGPAPASAAPSLVSASGPLADLSAAPNTTDGADAQLYASAR